MYLERGRKRLVIDVHNAVEFFGYKPIHLERGRKQTLHRFQVYEITADINLYTSREDGNLILFSLQ